MDKLSGCTVCRPSPLRRFFRNPSIEAVRDHYSDWLMSLKGVSGVFIDMDKKGGSFIRILTKDSPDDIKAIVGDKLNGYPVVFSQAKVVKR